MTIFVFAWAMLIPSQTKATRCTELTRLNLHDVTITSSTSVPAGQFTPPGSSTALETPEFCRVVAVAKPTSDSVINFEVWIPSGEKWNHDLEGIGNGGAGGPDATQVSTTVRNSKNAEGAPCSVCERGSWVFFARAPPFRAWFSKGPATSSGIDRSERLRAIHLGWRHQPLPFVRQQDRAG
jgi:hypothetical protein